MAIVTVSKGYRVKNTKEINTFCEKCRNETKHQLLAYPVGPQLTGIITPQKYGIGMRRYYLTCSQCSSLNYRIKYSDVKHYKY